jgi:glycosyltransferase involved in cell wall biosynthesis
MDDRLKLVLAEGGETLARSHRVVWELAGRLSESRFDVRVWLSAASDLDEMAGELSARGVPVERLPDVRSRWSAWSLLRAWRAMRRARPAVVHLHHRLASADRLESLLAELCAGPRLVISDHATAGATARERPQCRRTFTRADALTVPHDAAAEALVRDHGVERARVHVVPFGIDAPDERHEAPAARRLREDLGVGPLRPLWACLAPLEAVQGHGVLLEALAELTRRGIPYLAALEGDGPRRSELERRARELGIAEQVRLLGRLEDPGVLLAAADVAVFPLLSGAAPTAVPAAMARGRPVIGTAVSDLAQWVESPGCGRLVPPGDSAALAEALEGFYRRPDAARRLGLQGALRIQEEFSWERVAEAYESVYDEVLGLATFAPENEAAAHGAR